MKNKNYVSIDEINSFIFVTHFNVLLNYSLDYKFMNL